jgi:hypothetical protein
MSRSTGIMKSVLARHSVGAEPTHTGVVMRRSQIACRSVIALAGVYASVPASAKETIDCPAETATPSGGPQPTPSSRMFTDARFIAQFPVPTAPIPLCNDFSSRGFMALAWPAIDGRRGGPDGPLLGRAAGLMQKKGQADPKDWNEYGGSILCNVASGR